MRVVLLLVAIGLSNLPAVAVAQSSSRYDLPPGAGNLPAPSNAGAHDHNHDHGAAGHVHSPFEGLNNGGPLESLSEPFPPLNTRPASPPPATSRPAAQPAARPATPPTPMREPALPATGGRYGRPATPPSTLRASTDSDYAKRLMKATLTSQPGSQLTGSPIGLPAVVRSARSRQEQSQRINAYWDLCSAVADYYLSLREQDELERLAARSPQLSSPLRAAILKLKTRRDTALTAARATQHRLADLMQSGSVSSLPLPGDMPLCSTYRTKFSQTFSGVGPREAAELNRLLPLRHAELLDAAQAVTQSEEGFGQVVRQAGGATAAGEVVRALRLHALNRRAFVQIARDYNRRITRYTELARPGRVGSDRLVAMLIKTNSRTATRGSSASPRLDRSSWNAPLETFRDVPRDLAPRLDAEVVPAGAMITEKVTPDETSVLQREEMDRP